MKIIPLAHRHILVTSGPTQEAIDPVRFISNYSSGKQGHAIAAAFAQAGAQVTLVSGPVALADPAGVRVKKVTSAEEMLAACAAALPADIAICAAAVSDWRPVEVAPQKIKKEAGKNQWNIVCTQTVDILHHLSTHPTHRPHLVIGFAAETEQLVPHAQAKLIRKQCDVILANDVSQNIFGSSHNKVTLCTADSYEHWPLMRKEEVAFALVKWCQSKLSVV